MRYRNFIRLVSMVLALSIICMPVCAGVALAAENGEGWALVPPEISDGGEADLLFTLDNGNNPIYGLVTSKSGSAGRITLSSLPSGTKSIYYAGYLCTTAADNINGYSFRTGICYYKSATDTFVPIDYHYPQHGVYFSAEETRISIDGSVFSPYYEYYGFVRNLFPQDDTTYVYGYVSFFASQVDA